MRSTQGQSRCVRDPKNRPAVRTSPSMTAERFKVGNSAGAGLPHGYGRRTKIRLVDRHSHFPSGASTAKRRSLSEHARLLDELEQVGHWLARATQNADFPDRATAELVALTLQDLKDARALWHGSMSKEQRQEILRAVFNESGT